ncbi:CpaF family protein [Microbacterium bovistercoris]|uniref:CpaF family protein n=1 Tax=Microbacterium bovistercoris TaxID=2293570 RepID=A0A371NP11_9MICO|nr:CpaF family protein [Microbacterium bovistercoris]REJ03923.1 CpaF family protein [Microbacterium bovistercoris]
MSLYDRLNAARNAQTTDAAMTAPPVLSPLPAPEAPTPQDAPMPPPPTGAPTPLPPPVEVTDARPFDEGRDPDVEGHFDKLSDPASGEGPFDKPRDPAIPSAPVVDPLAGVKEKAAQELFGRIGTRLNDSSLTEEQLHDLARKELAEIVAGEQLALTVAERKRLIDDISADVLGYGPLEPLLDDPNVTEIMVNRFDKIYVEVRGRILPVATRFTGEPQLRRVIERIVARVGRRIDEASPMVDARLEDGSRVNAVIPPLAVDGSSLTIRKFAATPYTVSDLIRFGSLTPEVAAVLDAAVKAKLNVIVSGGTGTGKTTLLNVLSAFIPGDERIVTIEDAVELQLQQEHVVRLEARPQNIEGRGEVTIRDLVRNSLRMRPDRIVVGEVRGAESLDMLQAMNTGHEGSISTIHANSSRDAISRLETLVLMAGMDLPLRAIREQIASAVDVIVQIQRHKDGGRRVTHITEVHGMEGEIITLQDAFAFDHSAGYDHEGRVLGRLKPTGVRPRFAERIADAGITLPMSLFQEHVFDSPQPGMPR